MPVSKIIIMVLMLSLFSCAHRGYKMTKYFDEYLETGVSKRHTGNVKGEKKIIQQIKSLEEINGVSLLEWERSRVESGLNEALGYEWVKDFERVPSKLGEVSLLLGEE